MLYALEQAPVEQKIIQQCMRENLQLPNKIANAPTLELGLELYYNSYWDLSSCRSSGTGIGPIPWSSIMEYAMVYDFDEDQASDLFYYVRIMDNTYLDYHRNKEEGKWRSQKASANSRKELKS